MCVNEGPVSGLKLTFKHLYATSNNILNVPCTYTCVEAGIAILLFNALNPAGGKIQFSRNKSHFSSVRVFLKFRESKPAFIFYKNCLLVKHIKMFYESLIRPYELLMKCGKTSRCSQSLVGYQ